MTGMAEYIDKGRLIMSMNDWMLQNAPIKAGDDTIRADTILDAIKMVEDSPAANVRENVKSKWEDVEITMITEDNAPSEIVSMFCPNCKRYHNEVYHYGNPIENANFCPRCGATMEVQDGE